MKRLTILFILLISGLFSCQDAPELIFFSSSRSGNSDIYLMYADGTNTQRLTTSLFEEWAPVWIHAGQISFLRQKYEKIVRVTLNLENGEEKEIAHPAGCLLDDKNSLYDEINR